MTTVILIDLLKHMSEEIIDGLVNSEACEWKSSSIAKLAF